MFRYYTLFRQTDRNLTPTKLLASVLFSTYFKSLLTQTFDQKNFFVLTKRIISFASIEGKTKSCVLFWVHQDELNSSMHLFSSSLLYF